MRHSLLLSLALSVAVAATDFNCAFALPASPHHADSISPATNIENVRFAARGPRGGVAVGGRGFHGRGGYAGRGYAGRGYVGRGVGRGAYGIGRRAYGGVWYGTGRRFYGGRWWPYGVGACWRNSPIGFVWICG